MEHQDLTEKIIGCVYQVYNTIGYGFLESVYHKCLLVELGLANLRAESDHPINVTYKGQLVGEFVADVVVEDKVILELKAIEQLNKAHEVQFVNYLVATGKNVGLLINFGKQKIEIKRKVRELRSKHESC